MAKYKITVVARGARSNAVYKTDDLSQKEKIVRDESSKSKTLLIYVNDTLVYGN